MVNKICDRLMNRVKLKMPEVDEERAQIIRYGFELIIGEVPKFLLMFVVAILLGKINYFILSLLIIGSYRVYSGGFHLKTHIGCFIITNLLYFGNIYISELIFFPNFITKCITAMIVGIFAVFMILLYAPADTPEVPILRKKERRKNKIISIIVVLILITIFLLCTHRIISNMCIVGIFLQTLTITKVAYRIFNVKFGYFEQMKSI